jgi:5-methylcytosine-specific restriction endonuclease McrA
MRRCERPECDRRHYGKGLCHLHLDRERYLHTSRFLDELGLRSVSIYDIGCRDGWECGRCGWLVSDDDASADHVQPRSKNGNDEARNIRLTHKVCNSRRGSRPAVFSWPDCLRILAKRI